MASPWNGNTTLILGRGGALVALIVYLTWLGLTAIENRAHRLDPERFFKLEEDVQLIKQRQDERLRIFDQLLERVDRLEVTSYGITRWSIKPNEQPGAVK